MNIKFWTYEPEGQPREHAIDTRQGEPQMNVSASEAECRTFGLGVLQLDVHNDDTHSTKKGQECRFWITLKVRNGRPVVQVTTKDGKKETKRELVGIYKKK